LHYSTGYSQYIGENETHTEFYWGEERKRDHVPNLGVDGRVNLKQIFKIWDGGLGCIDLAQSRDRWRALVNAVMNLLYQ
jgi:hypothetical protein